MDYGPVVHYSQGISNGYAIICPQCSACRIYAVVHLPKVQGVFLKVMAAVSALFAYHVQMPLQHDGGPILHPRRRRTEYHYIAKLVLPCCIAPLAGKVQDILGYGTHIARAPRNRGYFLKKTKYRRRLQVCKFIHLKSPYNIPLHHKTRPPKLAVPQ